MPEINDRELIVTRMLAATPEQAFNFWTSPDHVSEWWGPDGYSTTTERMDLRPGGEWLFTMHGPDGERFENRVQYLEVEPPFLLRYEHRDRNALEPVRFEATITFAPVGAGTLLTMRMVLDSPEDLARVEEAHGASAGQWQTLARFIDRLTVHLADYLH